MRIVASEESYRSALGLLDERDRVQLEAAFPGRIDASNASLEEPKSETSKRSTGDIYQIDWSSFFGRVNEKTVAESRIVVLKISTFTRMLADTGNDTPKFVVEIAWKLAQKDAIYTARGRALGPTYVGRGRTTKNPEAIQSANIAFYAAFLKAMAQIAVQGSRAKNEPTRQP